MIGDSTERKMMRKKAFDNKYLGTTVQRNFLRHDLN